MAIADTEHSVAALYHLRPHIVERIRQQWQGTHALYRVLSSTTGDDVHQLGRLEPCREEFGRTVDDLA